MTAADWIAEQRRIEQAATEGPWDTSTTSWAPEARMVDVPDGDDEMSLAWEAGGGLCVMSRADAEFIVDARTALPKALDALEAVLARHPWECLECEGIDLDASPQCGHCYEPWPCPTVAAIAEALGVEP